MGKRYSGACRKFKYVSRERALAVLRDWRERDSERYDATLNVYHCARCSAWHIGNSDR